MGPRLRVGAFYGDVAAVPEGVAWVTSAGAAVVCEINGVERWRSTCPEPVMELRCAASPAGEVRAIVKGNRTGTAYEVRDGVVVQHGLTFGVQAVAIAWVGDRFVAYIFRSASLFSLVDLRSGTDLGRTYPAGTTSQGFLDVVDAVPIFADLARTRIVQGLTLAFPQTRGLVTIGQLDDDTHPAQIAGVVLVGTPLSAEGQAFTAIEGFGFEPHLAVLSDGRVAVCARTPLGAALVILPPYPTLVTREVPIVIIVPPEKPKKPKEPIVGMPVTPHQWITVEYPQLQAAYRENPNNAQILIDVPTAPNGEWGAFQGMRRFGELMPFDQMLADVAGPKEAP